MPPRKQHRQMSEHFIFLLPAQSNNSWLSQTYETIGNNILGMLISVFWANQLSVSENRF